MTNEGGRDDIKLYLLKSNSHIDSFVGDDPPKRNFCYYIKFSCLWKSDDPYLDAIKNLFNMVDWSKKENLEKPYFLKHSRE